MQHGSITDPCAADQRFFARLLCMLVSYRPLATRGRRTFLWLSPALAPFSQLLPTKTVTRPHSSLKLVCAKLGQFIHSQGPCCAASEDIEGTRGLLRRRSRLVELRSNR